MRLPNEFDPLTPTEMDDLTTQMRKDYANRGGLRDRELMACEMENIYRLMETAQHLRSVLRSVSCCLDNNKYREARQRADNAMKGTDLPERVRRNGIDFLKEGE